jgi:16S rRNA (adenine1518-N6/adenine1519-N6)-dimethyltransferase
VQTNNKIRKRFSQNFLVDENIIKKILYSIDPKRTERFVEIGPGMGALTFPILNHLNSLDVIEIDRDLVEHLSMHKKASKLNIHCMDALKFDFNTLCKKDQKLRLIGNLPYNISTPLMFHFLDYSKIMDDLHIMLQKEVADRVCAKPNTKTFGRLSVAIQARCKIQKLFEIKPNSFYPKPKVTSTLIRLIPNKKLEDSLANQLNYLLQLAFSKRRKKVSNALKTLFELRDFQRLSIDPEKRPENLTVDDYINLSKNIPD